MEFQYEIQLFLSRLYKIEQPYQLTTREASLINQKSIIFQSFLAEFTLETGEEISLKERESYIGVSDISLTYGEIDFISIAEIYYTIIHRYGGLPNGIFYDLGSGMGKCIIATALICDFSMCKGIEILEGLYENSQLIYKKYYEEFPKIVEKNPEIFSSMNDIEFLKGSFFNFDWSDAALIFANSTCFGSEMMEQIGSLPLKIGTLGISFTEVFIGEGWIVLESIRKKMSWGQATVYIQRYVGAESIRKVSNRY